MRDLLTILAGLLIVVLAAALVGPPFVDWEGQREAIDRAISRAAGVEARTEGRIRVRLLPSPRLRVDRLRLGSESADQPSLDARFVWAEMALTPLLSGRMRFTETRIGRAELRVPTASDGSWALPAGASEALRRELAFEDLFVAQLLLTLQAPATGRTDQLYAETVRIEGQSLAGPWRVEGVTSDVPFRLVTGVFGDGGSLPVKLTGGGDLFPRFDLDARVALSPTPGASPVSGTAKVLFGPPAQAAAAGLSIPVVAQAGFKWSGGVVELDPVTIEAGEGGGSLRLTGTGRIPVESTRVALKLDGRRLDLDRLLAASGAGDLRERAAAMIPLATPVDVDLSLASVALAQEELTDARLQVALEPGHVRVRELRFAAPGEARVTAQGEIGLAADAPISFRVSVTAAASERLGQALANLDGGAPFAAFLDGKPLDAAADIVATKSAATLDNVRVKLGDAVLTGSVRYTAPKGQARGRLEARIGAQGVDLARLPQAGGVLGSNLDLSLVLDARNLRYGDGPPAGRVTARIASDGPALLVEALDITDLAGASARVSGRIAADGSGRIEGRLTARRAAPLIDLLGGVGVGGVARLVPNFLREGDLDVGLTAERAAPDPFSGAPALRTALSGTAAGGPLQADLRTVAGRTEAFTVRLETANTGLWVGRPDLANLRRPSSLDVKGARTRSGLLDVTLAGAVGGMRIGAARPFELGAADDTVETGEAEIVAADISPFLTLLGEGAVVPGPVAAEGRLKLDREGEATRLDWSGRVAGTGAQAEMRIRPDGAVDGAVSVDRLSLPWLLSALALNSPADPRSTALWPTARFGKAGRAVATGQASFKVGRLDLGRALQAETAAFSLSVNPDGLALRDLDAGLAGGRLTGQLTIARHEGLASFVGEGRLSDAALPFLLGPSLVDGRLGASLKFGSSGESLAGVVANLAGAGEIRLVDLRVAQGDPGALERALPRVLNESDPLNSRRIEALLGEELARGPLVIPDAVAPASLVGGGLRFGPLVASTPTGTWQGAAALDFKTLRLDAVGLLTARAEPKGWGGPPPSVALAWRGPVAAPSRSVDVGPVLNGLAALVLQRELEKIEAFEAEASERARLRGRLDYERDLKERERRAADEARRVAEEAVRQARLAAEEEARRGKLAAEDAARRQAEEARQARIREQQAVEEARLARIREQRAAEEAARQARIREQQEAVETARQARIRSQEAAEAARQARSRDQQAAEEARQARAREQQAEAERLRANSSLPPLPDPIEIRPAPSIQGGPGG